MELREELRGPRIASAGAETIRPAVSCQLGAAGAIVTRMTGKPDRSQLVTIDAMLAASKRDTRRVPIRNTFVQQGSQSDPEPGPLHEMVRRHDERCLDLFLLHRMMASADPWDVRPMPAKAWARALGVHHDRDGGKAAVSKAWRRLDQTYHLIEVGRSGRRGKYTSLSEDGSGDPYTSPDGRARTNRYLTLPFEYWTGPDFWFRQLSLPAKAVLLIGSSLAPGFLLPTTEKAQRWYGISGDTVGRGLTELLGLKLLERASVLKDTPLEDSVQTREYRYTLAAPFGRQSPPKKKSGLSLIVTKGA